MVRRARWRTRWPPCRSRPHRFRTRRPYHRGAGPQATLGPVRPGLLLIGGFDELVDQLGRQDVLDPIASRRGLGPPAATGAERWAAYLELDGVLGEVAEGADGRLGFQAAFPVHR